MGLGGSTERHGYRIVNIQKDSPAESAGLVPYFDFIIEANDIPFVSISLQLLFVLSLFPF